MPIHVLHPWGTLGDNVHVEAKQTQPRMAIAGRPTKESEQTSHHLIPQRLARRVAHFVLFLHRLPTIMSAKPNDEPFCILEELFEAQDLVW